MKCHYCLKEFEGRKSRKFCCPSHSNIFNGFKKGVIPWNKSSLHWLYKSAFYDIWTNMKTRCSNINTNNYKDYGGRGIKVSYEWKNFKNFYEDMYLSYIEGLTLDRIDNNGNYEKSNCRWVDKKMQAENRRNTHLFEFNGIKNTLTNWANLIGLNRSTLSMRVYVYNWKLEKALTTPIKRNNFVRH